MVVEPSCVLTQTELAQGAERAGVVTHPAVPMIAEHIHAIAVAAHTPVEADVPAGAAVEDVVFQVGAHGPAAVRS